jgi:Protein of unknown function (DUF3347)
MKTKSHIVSLLMAAVAILVLVNCGGKKDAAHDNHDAATEVDEKTTAQPTAPLFTVDAAFQQQLAGVFTSYVSLKESFVAANPATVKSSATHVAQALVKADMKLLTGAAHNDWMNYLGGMEGALKEMQATDDIEAQRIAFKNLSDGLYKSIKAFGLGGTTAYYEYCPMAFNNTGAYWLSDNSTIRNPYFGDKMLSCGAVEETLQ